MVVVEGEPIGKGRPRVSSRSGTVYTPRKTVAYEDALRFAAKLSKDRLGMAPAIAIIRAFSEPPTSWSQKKKKVAVGGRVQKITKPDIDNVVKSALDGIQDVCFEDDRQIVACVAVKAYDVRARLEIELLAIKDEGEVLIAQGEGRSFEGCSLEDLLAKVLGGGSCGARLADGEEAGELVEGLRAA